MLECAPWRQRVCKDLFAGDVIHFKNPAAVLRKEVEDGEISIVGIWIDLKILYSLLKAVYIQAKTVTNAAWYRP